MVLGWVLLGVAFGILTGDLGGSKEKADKKAALYRLLAFMSGIVSGVLLMV